MKAIKNSPLAAQKTDHRDADDDDDSPTVTATNDKAQLQLDDDVVVEQKRAPFFEPQSSSWEHSFDQVASFHEQRSHLVSHTLEEDRKRAPDSIGFEKTDPQETKTRLISNAKTWKNWFYQLLHYQRTNGHCNVRQCENKSLYYWVRKQRSHLESNNLEENRKKELDSIGFEWTAPSETTRHGMLGAAWQNQLNQLLDYHKMNGHFNVRACENKTLYYWVREQRRLFDSKTLDENKKRQLDSIGFEWVAPPETTAKVMLDATWEKKFGQLLDYQKMNGHCNVRACENKLLYSWVREQRRRFYSFILDEDRKKQLETIGFDWAAPPETTTKVMSNAAWKNSFDQLLNYQKMNGHYNVRAFENIMLYDWVRNQRRLFYSNNLDEDRKKQLETIGFDWTSPPETTTFDPTWNDKFDQLSEYQKMNGHCNVRARENRQLYEWVRKQRRQFASKTLDANRKRKLDSIGFEWIFDAVWKNKFDEMSEYQKMNGHCKVRACENEQLYRWVRNQNRHFYLGTLDQDRKRQLDSIGFEWTAPTGKTKKEWKTSFDELLDFHKMNGHCNVRPCENASLYFWVRKQRSKFESNTLDAYRKRQLDSIGFEWIFDAVWKNKFDKMSEYQKMNGHCNVRSRENRQLYRWSREQRRLFDSNTLDGNRKRQLDSIGFEWTAPPGKTRKGWTDATWKDNFYQLLEYQKVNGHCMVRKSESPPLYRWVREQRSRFYSNTLDEDRKKQLDSIGFELKPGTPDSKNEEYDDGDEEGLEFDDVRRSLAKPPSGKFQENELYKAGFGLQTEPDPHRIDTKEIRQLQHFRHVHGHCNVTAEQDEALARWVSRQRRLFRRGKLSKEQKEQLESIDGFHFAPVATGSSNYNDEFTVLGCHEASDHDDYYHGNDDVKEDKAGNGYNHHNPGLADSRKRPALPQISCQPKIGKKRRRSYSPTPDNQQSSLPTLSTMEAQQEARGKNGTRRTRQEVQGKLSESEKVLYVHKRVAKPFNGQLFAGTVVSFRDVDDKITYWKVEYDDGDSEEFDLEELKRFMSCFDSCLSLSIS